MVRAGDRADRIRRGAAALRARPRLDLVAGVDPLRACGAVPARRRLDVAGGRPCARRRVLRAARRRAPRRGSICSARCCCCFRSRSRSSGFRCPYVARSWAILERSRETSGLPLVFLLKTLIPLFAAAARAAGRRAGDRVGRACLRTMLAQRAAARARKRRTSADASPRSSSPILMVIAVCGLLFAGYPVALTLGGVSFAFAALGASRSARWTSACSTRCRSASSA